MKKTIFGLALLLIISTCLVWAEGAAEAIGTGINKTPPGARIILEANGYRFNSSNDPISYNSHPIAYLSHQTYSNPHSFDKNVIYITNFTVNQWVNKSILAITGSEAIRQSSGLLSSPDFQTILQIGGSTPMRGTRIFIRNIPDRFLGEIGSYVQNASLAYIGVQTFRMADGSEQVFPVFELTGFFNNTVSQAMNTFNNAFEAGIYKTENDYQYSKIGNRTFGRDIATKRELHEWNGSQWIVLTR